MQQIINQVVEFRKKNGLTQEKFAEPLGVKGGAISAFEKGRANNPQLLKKIEEVYGIKFDSKGLVKNSNNSNESLAWYKNLLEEMRDQNRRLQDQVDRLTRMLENQLGKPFDVILGGLASAGLDIESKVIDINSGVANSVTSQAKSA